MRLIKKTDIYGVEVTEFIPDVFVCDFCCDRQKPVRWQFTAKDSTISWAPPPKPGGTNVILREGKTLFSTDKALQTKSTGGKWASCSQCRILVEARQIKELALYSAHSYIENNKLTLGKDATFRVLLKQITSAQQAFWRNWDGQQATQWSEEVQPV